MKVKDFIKHVIGKHGTLLQYIIAIEEMSELQKEISKFIRYGDNQESIKEEIADVQLVLWELEEMFGIENFDVETAIHAKIGRYLEQLEQS